MEMNELVEQLRKGVRTMTYTSTLGQGSYKQVWRVAVDGTPYALTTQRFSNANIKRRKLNAQNATAELRMAAFLQTAVAEADAGRFETVLSWWTQSQPMQADDGGRLIPAATTSQEIVTSGARSSWAYALKPLYDYDLHQLVAIVDTEGWEAAAARGALVGSEADAVRLVRDMLAAVAALHSVSVVHADIKPANLMVKDGAGVLIDFGYARRVGDGGCQGAVRGEPAYVLESDVRRNRTCYAGDAYALGKALFETVFVYEAPADVPNDFSNPTRVGELVSHLRAAMAAAAPVPRFVGMSAATQHAVLCALRALCRAHQPDDAAAALALLDRLLAEEGASGTSFSTK